MIDAPPRVLKREIGGGGAIMIGLLIYYAITNPAALRLSREQRLFPRWIAVAGLAACLFLALWVPMWIWVAGLALIGAGLAWHRLARSWRRGPKAT